MSDENVVLLKQQNGIAIIRLNRPDAMNALDMATLKRLALLLDTARTDDSVQALIITGSGPTAFSAGADIRCLHHATPMEVREFARLAVLVNHKIETLGKMVLAAVNGYALGGGLELAESCMLRVAVPDAKMGHPEVHIGAVAGFGGTTRLPRLVGRGRAAELLIRGRVIGAEEALQIGLVHSVVATERLICESENLLSEVLANSPTAVKLTWDALHRGLNLTLEESALLGAELFGLAASTDDFRARTKAFLEK